MISRLLLLAATALLPGTSPEPSGFPQWGGLAPGPHAVGFESRWEPDPSRRYDTALPDGTRFAQGKAPRPILVNVWYPAVAAVDAPRMRQGDYFDIAAEDPRLAALAAALSAYEADTIVEWVLGRSREDLDEAERAELEGALAAPTACVRDARPAAGRFPLVLFHSGYQSTFEDNSVWCEYLASHGYVVMGSAFLEESGESFNVDGGDGSVRDLAFLVGLAADDPRVDWDRIAAAGHSGGAHAALQFNAQPGAPVDAVISLDTTQDYASSLDPHWRHPAAMLENVEHETAPMLVLANPHGVFATCDAMVRAERYYLTTSALEHDEFTSQGVVTAEVAARLARARETADADDLEARARRVRDHFERCTEYARLFLDAQLEGDAAAREALANLHRGSSLGGADLHVEFVAAGAAGPDPYDPTSGAPPTPRQVFQGVLAEGAGPWLPRLQRVRDEAPDGPLQQTMFAFPLLFELVARGRMADADVLAPYFAAQHPSLVRVFAWWIDRSEGPRYREYRRVALEVARRLDPENEDFARKLEEAKSERW